MKVWFREFSFSWAISANYSIISIQLISVQFSVGSISSQTISVLIIVLVLLDRRFGVRVLEEILYTSMIMAPVGWRWCCLFLLIE